VKGITNEADKVVRFPYHEDASGRELRYYQRIAIQRTVEAVARGQRRVLLAMIWNAVYVSRTGAHCEQDTRWPRATASTVRWIAIRW